MKLTPPVNPNYCASIVEITTLVPLEGCDNVQGTLIFGFQAIVGKNMTVGTKGVVFCAETQLSEEFCKENNLYRHVEKNKNPQEKGYIEDNRRIRAMRFRGHTSNALFLPLSCFSYLGIKEEDFSVGDTFDTLLAKEICTKYVIKHHAPITKEGKKRSTTSRVDGIFLPEHITTDNYFRNMHKIAPNTEVIVTQKLHGTSIRIAHTKVNRFLTWLERIARFLGVQVQTTEFDYVFGSRKVIKDPHNPNHQHYYKEDIWTREGMKIQEHIPRNFILYGELVGFVEGNTPIQQGYTYHCAEGECALYIYRVSFINDQGYAHDLSWEHTKMFCHSRGIQTVPEIFRGNLQDVSIDDFMDTSYFPTYKSCIPLSNKDTVDEGVCIRVDTPTPYILKAKSPLFYEWETKMLDTQVEDIESITQ